MDHMPSAPPTYYPLRLAARFCPRSSRTKRHPHVSALRRWVSKGLKAADGTRVYLRARKRGAALCVTRADLERFFVATAGDTAIATDEEALPTNAKSRIGLQAGKRAEQELDAAGI